MTFWIAVIAVTIITFVERASFILFLSQWRLPSWLDKALRFVPATVFPALVAPMFIYTDGQLDLSPLNPKLLAGLVAVIVSWRTKSLLGTILAGMAVIWLWNWLLG